MATILYCRLGTMVVKLDSIVLAVIKVASLLSFAAAAAIARTYYEVVVVVNYLNSN